MRGITFLVSLFVVGASATAVADAALVTLPGGGQVRGDVTVYIPKKRVTVRTPDGETFTFRKGEFTAVHFSDSPAVSAAKPVAAAPASAAPQPAPAHPHPDIGGKPSWEKRQLTATLLYGPASKLKGGGDLTGTLDLDTMLGLELRLDFPLSKRLTLGPAFRTLNWSVAGGELEHWYELGASLKLRFPSEFKGGNLGFEPYVRWMAAFVAGFQPIDDDLDSFGPGYSVLVGVGAQLNIKRRGSVHTEVGFQRAQTFYSGDFFDDTFDLTVQGAYIGFGGGFQF